MNSTCTYNNFVADITGIVNGSITSTGGLSAGANTSLTTFTGSYPSTYYTAANTAGAYTYVKTYSANSSTNNYFTIGFNGTTGISSLTLGVGYANSTNTYTASNTYTFPAVIGIQTYSSIDIVINNNLFYITNPSSGAYGAGVFDLGYNGMTQNFTAQQTAAIMPVSNLVSTTLIPVNPYAYTLNSYSYTSTNTTTAGLSYVIPTSGPYNASGNVAVIENPVFMYNSLQGNAISLVYGLSTLVQGEYIPRSVYTDTNSINRYVIGTDTATFAITIT